MKPENLYQDLIGTQHIYEMEMWDEEFFNEEGQAYIRLEEDAPGEFNFSVLRGGIDGKIIGKTFEFNWEGIDGKFDKSGSGKIKLKSEDLIEGEFWIYLGDSSTFLARRAKQRKKEIKIT